MKISAMFGRSVLTSLFTSALDFAVLTVAVEVFHINYVFATWIGTVVGSLSNFAINRSWAFKGSALGLRWQLARFVAVQVGASGLHTLGVWLMVRFGGLPYQIAKLIIAAAVGLGWNYPLNRAVVFSRRLTPPVTGLPDPPSASSGT